MFHHKPMQTALHQLAQTLEGQSNLLFAKMRQLDQQQNEQKKTAKRRSKEEGSVTHVRDTDNSKALTQFEF